MGSNSEMVIGNILANLNFLFFPVGVILKKDSRGNSIIEGKLYKDISKASSSGQYSIFYNINTYIVWEVNNFFFKSSKLDTIRFNTYQIKFHIQ